VGFHLHLQGEGNKLRSVRSETTCSYLVLQEWCNSPPERYGDPTTIGSVATDQRRLQSRYHLLLQLLDLPEHTSSQARGHQTAIIKGHTTESRYLWWLTTPVQKMLTCSAWLVTQVSRVGSGWFRAFMWKYSHSEWNLSSHAALNHRPGD